MVLTVQPYWKVFYFCGWVGGVEKSRLKLTSAKVEVKVEDELDKKGKKGFLCNFEWVSILFILLFGILLLPTLVS